MPDQIPACEQFGAKRAKQIDELIRAATGESCPGRCGDRCPLTPPAEAEDRHLSIVV